MAKNERLCFTMNAKVRRQFITICSLRGINRSHVVEDFLMKWIEENTTPEFLIAFDEAEKTRHLSNNPKNKK